MTSAYPRGTDLRAQASAWILATNHAVLGRPIPDSPLVEIVCDHDGCPLQGAQILAFRTKAWTVGLLLEHIWHHLHAVVDR